MVSKATKIRLGVFIAIGSLLILVFAGVVAGSRLVQRRDIYYIQFENYSVSGLQVGGAVNYQGIKVGRVDNIRIDPKDVTKIIVTISIDAGTPIKADTEAILSMVGITGLKAVEIRGGTNQSAVLKPKSFIKPGVSLMDDITDRAVSIAEKIDEIANNINELTNSENRKNIAIILQQTGQLITDTQANLSTTMVSLTRVANNVADLTDGLGKNIDQITDNLNKNMDTLTQRSASMIDSLSMNSNQSIIRLTETLNDQLLAVTKDLDKSIADIVAQGKSIMNDTQLHINNIGTHTDQLVLESTKQVTTVSSNLNKSLEHLNVLLGSPEFQSLLANLAAMSGKLAQADLSSMVTELSTTIQKAGQLMSTLNRVVVRGQGNLLDTLDSLAEASENLNEFTRQISDTPSILLRGN